MTHFSENPGILLVGIPTINDQRDAEEEAMVHDSRVHVYGVRMACVGECLARHLRIEKRDAC